MTIGIVVNKATHSLTRNTVHISELQHTNLKISELLSQRLCFLISEACQSVFIAIYTILAILCKHVGNVFLLGTYEQMQWIATKSIIAMVTNNEVISNIPISKLESKAMRSNWGFTIPKLPISIGESTFHPGPAVVNPASVYSFPKHFGELINCHFRTSQSSVVVVIVQKTIGYTIANPSFQSTAAMAVTIWDFVSVVVSGILAHVISSFVASGRATGCFQQRRGFRIGRFSIAQACYK